MKQITQILLAGESFTLAIFAKKNLPQTFGWVLNMALGNTIKKVAI